MRFNLTDIIAAIATPAGTSALSIIRVSGSNSISIVSNIFTDKNKLYNASGYQAVHGYIVDNEDIIDEVICLVYRNPQSYTGEDMVEISGHGNPDLCNRILQLLLKQCRIAEPGEFTFRAFMNHKLDLAQAEAVSDLIHAQTAKAEISALNQLKGNLSNEITNIIKELTDSRIQFELSIDFADQDLPEIDLEKVTEKLQQIHTKLKELYKNGKQGRILRDGFTVCLCGAPNVGKSSVFNKFLEQNRAIVTPEPGTTRDYLEEWLSLDGYPVKLIDTAGLRTTKNQVEKIGIERTKDLISKADMIIYLTDPDTVNTELADANLTVDARTIFTINKIDLLGFENLPDDKDWTNYLTGTRFGFVKSSKVKIHPCSTYFVEGINTLKEQILNRISLPKMQVSTILVTNTRHLAAIEKAIESLSKAMQAISDFAGYEFIAFDLIEAISSLSEITGTVTTDDMLDRIFSDFCIGK